MSLQDAQRMQEMEADELQHNINMLRDIQKYQPMSPCKLFYELKKSVPLSVFLKVYPFHKLVDCSLDFTLDELMEIKRLYYTFHENNQKDYIDSFRKLEEIIANRIRISSGKGFQPWKKQVEENREVQDIMRKPEPSESEIDSIAELHYYMQNQQPGQPPPPPPPPPPPLPLPPPPPPPAQVTSLLGKFKDFFSLSGGRKKTTCKKMSKSRHRRHNNKSRSKMLRYKKSRSRSRSKK